MAEIREVNAPASLNLSDVFSRWRGSDVFFLTYTFDLPFFESHLLPRLVGGGAESITVVVDARWLRERLPQWTASNEIRHAGSSYVLCGIEVPGTFHPKVVLMADQKRGSLLIGSGNISTYGMATGGELFSYVNWEGEDVPDLAREVWQASSKLAENPKVDNLVLQQLRRIGGILPSPGRVVDHPLIAHNLNATILDQVFQRIGNQPVSEIILWSPFWDRKLHALARLVEQTKPQTVTIGFQPGLTSIDPLELEDLVQQQREIEWKFVKLVTSNELEQRRAALVHAKGILLRLGSGRELLLSGSPNISAPALLTTSANGNVEIATMVEGAATAQQLFAEDGPIQLGDPIDIHTMKWEPHETVRPALHGISDTLLTGARLDGRDLTLHVTGRKPANPIAILDQPDRIELSPVDGGFRGLVETDIPPRTVTLEWDGGTSGPVSIANMQALAAMRSQKDSRARVPFEALDYGGDEEIIAILEELARHSIIDIHDLQRMMRGNKPATEHDDALEAGENPPHVDLSSINFDAIAQHPRSSAYRTGTQEFMDTPSLQVWLDEVVQQFNSLRDHFELRLVQPVAGDEVSDTETEEAEVQQSPRRWSVSAKIKVRVRNRIQRFIRGVSDPRFQTLVSPEVMAVNYTLFLNFLYLLRQRAIDGHEVLPEHELSTLMLELLTSFWGNDEKAGYLGRLDADDKATAGLTFLERHAHALTFAIAHQLIRRHDDTGKLSPFTVASIVSKADELGLLDIEAADQAVAYLKNDQVDGGKLLEALEATTFHFTWERYLYLLARRFSVKRVELRITGDKGFISGETLRVSAEYPITEHSQPVAILADWTNTTRSRGNDREVFQMEWQPGGDVIIYDLEDGSLWWRIRVAQTGNEAQTAVKNAWRNWPWIRLPLGVRWRPLMIRVIVLRCNDLCRTVDAISTHLTAELAEVLLGRVGQVSDPKAHKAPSVLALVGA